MVFEVVWVVEYPQPLSPVLSYQTALVVDSQVQLLACVVLLMHVHADLAVEHPSDRLRCCARPQEEGEAGVRLHADCECLVGDVVAQMLRKLKHILFLLLVVHLQLLIGVLCAEGAGGVEGALKIGRQWLRHRVKLAADAGGKHGHQHHHYACLDHSAGLYYSTLSPISQLNKQYHINQQGNIDSPPWTKRAINALSAFGQDVLINKPTQYQFHHYISYHIISHQIGKYAAQLNTAAAIFSQVGTCTALPLLLMHYLRPQSYIVVPGQYQQTSLSRLKQGCECGHTMHAIPSKYGVAGGQSSMPGWLPVLVQQVLAHSFNVLPLSTSLGEVIGLVWQFMLAIGIHLCMFRSRIVLQGHDQHLKVSYEKWVGLAQPMHELPIENGVFQGHYRYYISDFFKLIYYRISSIFRLSLTHERWSAREQYFAFLQFIDFGSQQQSDGQLVQVCSLGLKQYSFWQSMHCLPSKKGRFGGHRVRFYVLLANYKIVWFQSSSILCLAAAQLVNRTVPANTLPFSSKHCRFDVSQVQQLKQLWPWRMKYGLYLGHCLHLPYLSAKGISNGQNSGDGCLISYWVSANVVIFPNPHMPAFKLVILFICSPLNDCSLPIDGLKYADCLLVRQRYSLSLRSAVGLLAAVGTLVCKQALSCLNLSCMWWQECRRWSWAMGLNGSQVHGVVFKLQ